MAQHSIAIPDETQNLIANSDSCGNYRRSVAALCQRRKVEAKWRKPMSFDVASY
jgi:hypothetical protein